MIDPHSAKITASASFVTAIWTALAPALPEYFGLALIAGAFGGASRWAAERQKVWPDGMATMFLGITAAAFLWPIGNGLLNWAIGGLPEDALAIEPASAVMLGAFVTGLGGATIIGGVIDILDKRFKDEKDNDNES